MREGEPADRGHAFDTGRWQADSSIACFPGTAGIRVKHLGTGEEAGVRANVGFTSASVIKRPMPP